MRAICCRRGWPLILDKAMPDLQIFMTAIGDVPAITDPVLVRQKSRDMTAAFSPIMKKELADKSADVIVRPRDKAEIARVASAAARARLPLIARGGGTANFGQGIPLAGGAILDLTGYEGVVWKKSGAARLRAGTRLADIDNATRPDGWELRIYSSTKKTATIGGFVGGGHSGIGAAVHGILRDRGNILGLEVMSVEETPKTVELRGADCNLVHHAYGANGIMTEVEVPLSPAWAWREAYVHFADFADATRFAVELAAADGIVRKVISLQQWPIPSMIRAFANVMKPGHSAVLALVAEPSLEHFADLVKAHNGIAEPLCEEGTGPWGLPLYELVWGHTLFNVNKTDRSRKNVAGLFPPDDLVGAIGRAARRFADVGPLHLEAKRIDGKLSFQGSPLFSYRDEAQMAEIVRGLTEEGCEVANNHTFLVKEGGMKVVDDRDFEFKRLMDPYDLMNPGKLTTDAQSRAASAGAALPTAIWNYKRAI
jgi:FAD/FMN-containing dehydrogenase